MIQVQRLSEGAVLPTKAYVGDAGWDLYASVTMEIPPGEAVDVPCGIAVAIPQGYFGRITGRSSTFRKRRVQVFEGVIDAGFRGELYALALNWNGHPITVQAGERIAQMLIHEVPALPMVERDTLPVSQRGTAGFGSSGA